MLNEFLYLLPELKTPLILIGVTSLLVAGLWVLDALDIYLRAPKESRKPALFLSALRAYSRILLVNVVLGVMFSASYYDARARGIHRIQRQLFTEYLVGRDCVALNQNARSWRDHVFMCGEDLCAPSHRDTTGDIRNAWTCKSGAVIDYQNFEESAETIYWERVQDLR